MSTSRSISTVSRFFANYGMLGVLALLCLYYSWATLKLQPRLGADAANALARELVNAAELPSGVLIVAKDHADDIQFADRLAAELQAADIAVVEKIHGEPPAVRKALERLVAAGNRVDCIATTEDYRSIISNISKRMPRLTNSQITAAASYWWPTFLLAENLLNVANQIVVIAVIAVGMTMVIVAGGIDLSVGSLVALSAVVTGTLIVAAGGLAASPVAMFFCSLAAIATCAAVGTFSGMMITVFRIPPFIATLAMMQVTSGLAYTISRGGSIYQLPASFTWLGRESSLLEIPNTVVLMLLIYALAHLIMSRTRLGRYIYAVGGNRQAARLSGIRTNRVVMLTFVVSGTMAGLGGVIEASVLKSGGPTYGLMYELYVIAAVVVGGTSLAGGEGKILGTLIGAFIIAVIRNGMNLTDVENYTQKIVLGLVILGAVLLDMIRKRGWRGWITENRHE